MHYSAAEGKALLMQLFASITDNNNSNNNPNAFQLMMLVGCLQALNVQKSFPYMYLHICVYHNRPKGEQEIIHDPVDDRATYLPKQLLGTLTLMGI
jgi:hypothetical protein